MKKRILAMLLAGMMVVPSVSGNVFAEEKAAAEETTEETAEAEEETEEKEEEKEEEGDLNPYDLTLTLGSNSYTFPMSLEDCKAAGINVPEVEVEEGHHKDVPVDNGRSAFELRLELVDGELWAVGFKATMEKTPNAEVAGIQWNELTKGEIRERFSTRPDFAEADDFGNSFVVDVFEREYEWWVRFEENDDNAKVKSIEVYSEIPHDFGVVYSDQAGVEDTDLPDVASMPFDSVILDGKYYDKNTTVQDLLDDGWLLKRSSGSAEDAVQPNYGYRGYIYNGSGIARIAAYNYSGEEAKLADCKLDTVDVYYANNTSIKTADGLDFDSTVADFEATLSTTAEEREDTAGELTFKIYSFTVLNGVEYVLAVADDKILEIKIANIQ